MTRPVYVDARYEGSHGIARYAREVVGRVGAPWLPLGGQYRPGSPRDAFDRHRLRVPRNAVLYNPGYTAGFARCTQLLTVHDLTHLHERESQNRAKRLYYDRLVRPAILKAGHVFTVSDTSADELREWLGASSVEITVTGNGCSGAFSQDGAAFAPPRPYVLFVGNFKWHKNPEPLFEAMRAFPDLDLRVVSGDRESAARLGGEAGMLDRMHLHTDVPDGSLAAMYRGAELLAFPSLWEGFGLPVLEALRCGTKVVHFSGAASVVEICGDSQFAFDDPYSAASIAEQISRALVLPFERPVGLARHEWSAVAEAVVSRIEKIA